ncbi:hypothetical protein P4J22_27905 [Bacillus cereus]|nr:hypothetical protein [Bacillus cereus]
MAGLVVGAIDLSIWVSVSQATNPEENKYYTIHLETNSNIGDEILLFTYEKYNI